MKDEQKSTSGNQEEEFKEFRIFGNKQQRKKQRKSREKFRRAETKTLRGVDLDELKTLKINKQINFLTSRRRRTFLRKFESDRQKTLKKLLAPDTKVIRTHCKDLPIIPSFLNKKVFLHNGKKFVEILIKHDMIGHYLGEFVLTRAPRKHVKKGQRPGKK
jgi:small subunit ribosomal protein S19